MKSATVAFHKNISGTKQAAVLLVKRWDIEHTRASFSSVNWGEKHCIRIPVAFRLYLVKIIQILTN
jgi:hypothetical protein